jgi:hypothetical protein
MAKHRDEGMLPSDSLGVIRRQEREEPDHAAYYAWMREIVLTVHKQGWMTPTMAQQHVELDCFETASTRLPLPERTVATKKGRKTR